MNFHLGNIFEKHFSLSVQLWLKKNWISNFAEIIREKPIFYFKNLMQFSNFEDRLLKNQSIDCCEIRNVHAWCKIRLFLFFGLLWKICLSLNNTVKPQKKYHNLKWIYIQRDVTLALSNVLKWKLFKKCI